MKLLTTCALLVLSCGLFAANGVKQVDGATFVLQEGVWVQQGLQEATLPHATAVVYEDARWQSWHAQGSETLRQILDLGPSVVFQMPARDGELRIFSVHTDTDSRNGSVDVGSGSTSSVLGDAFLVGATMTRGGQSTGSGTEPPLGEKEK